MADSNKLEEQPILEIQEDIRPLEVSRSKNSLLASRKMIRKMIHRIHRRKERELPIELVSSRPGTSASQGQGHLPSADGSRPGSPTSNASSSRPGSPDSTYSRPAKRGMIHDVEHARK